MRKAVAGFRDSEGEITRARRDAKKLRKAKKIKDRLLMKGADKFLWVAAVNKYFAAIVVPTPKEGKDYCDWVTGKTGRFYNPDGDERNDSGDETIGVDLKIGSRVLAPADQANNAQMYNFHLYLGPKDKSLFDKNKMYRELGFVQTIDFRGCCCPASIISPLAFGILAIMKWMYGFVANYGVVIIILVLLMRLCMHPITKKSQVSMSKFSKLAPKVEEVKKKYANNKAEMNKQMMALYREQGASPIMGFLPMMVQMPIWIALWSAVYASIDLRGAPFLPFWITDLSVPDALVRFATITVPLLGWKIKSLNLLPLLMGVAMYLQQKLMPRQAGAATNPQMAQQQKMMMIMFPLFLPLILYNAPSGVNLYIMASTFAGVFEQYVIRKHIREKEEAESKGLVAATSKTGGKVKKKKPKPFYKNM
jgi:YidC/Oxa1 family membrane protein insertase